MMAKLWGHEWAAVAWMRGIEIAIDEAACEDNVWWLEDYIAGVMMRWGIDWA